MFQINSNDNNMLRDDLLTLSFKSHIIHIFVLIEGPFNLIRMSVKSSQVVFQVSCFCDSLYHSFMFTLNMPLQTACFGCSKFAFYHKTSLLSKCWFKYGMMNCYSLFTFITPSCLLSI